MKRFLIWAFCLGTLSSSAQITNSISNTDKIYGLSKFWQEVNYNFVFLNKVDLDKWNAEYKNLIQKVQETKNDYEYYRLLQKFCATLKDGHTEVSFPNVFYKDISVNELGEYRLELCNIDGKAILVRINKSKKDEIPVGSEVIEVNGKPTSEYLAEEVIPYISSSTDYVLMDEAIYRMFQSIKGTSFNVVFRLPDGTTKKLALTSGDCKEKEMQPEGKKWELLKFKWLEDDIAYVQLNSFSNPKIDSLFIEKLPELYKAKRIILDLRGNGGGSTNIGLEILKYLTKDSLLYGSRSVSRLHIPAFKAWGKYMNVKDTANDWVRQGYLTYRNSYFHYFPFNPDTNKVDAKRIVVPTAILIGHGTASAAEDFLVYTDNQKHMVKIGTPSYGSTGQPFDFEMPGGGYARVCTKNDTYPDGREFIGYGVQPDIKVDITLDDYIANRDVVLQKAIEYLKTK